MFNLVIKEQLIANNFREKYFLLHFRRLAYLLRHCIELQSDVQLEEKFIQVSLLERKIYSALHEYLYLRADFFFHTKNTKIKITRKILDEHPENTLHAAASIEANIDEMVPKETSSVKEQVSSKIFIFFLTVIKFNFDSNFNFNFHQCEYISLINVLSRCESSSSIFL